MGALWFRLRSELRSRWLPVVGLGLIAGLAGAAVLTAVAGARRTDTAYERMLEATDAADFVVRSGGGSTALIDAEAITDIPSVARVGVVDRYYLTTPGPRATVTERVPVLASASTDDVAFAAIGRPNVVEGRLPDPERSDEILVSTVLRDEGGFDVGDDAPLVLVSPDASTPEGIRVEDVDLRVVGVGVTPEQIGIDEQRQSGLQMLLTPAFARQHPDQVVESSVQVVLRPGADARGFASAARATAPDEAIDVVSTAADAERVDRAIRPQVVALWVFAAVLAIAALLVFGQALGRHLALSAVDDPTLGALGLGRRRRVELGVLRAMPVALVAGGVAAVGAVLASPLMPLGPARVADPDPGLDVDAAVLALGAVLLVLVILLVALPSSWRLARRSLAGDESAPERTRVAERLAALGAPPTAVAGTRFALEPGRGPTAVPTRSALVGVTVATAAVVAAIVVAGNLRHVVDTPGQWGATWDVTLHVAADSRELPEGEFDIETILGAKELFVEDELEQARDVAAWSVGAANNVQIEGRAVPALGIDRAARGGGGVRPAVVQGRLPRTAGEVALGADTLADLDAKIGDSVRTPDGPLDVVGVSVLPRFQTLGGADEAALGRGAVLTLEGVLERSPDFYSRAYLVRLRPGTTVDAAVSELRQSIPDVFAFEIAPVQAPEDVESLSRVTDTPVALAAVLGILALATLAHALVTSVRRRRRDLAILVTLGFTRRQLRAQVAATVAWQATVVMTNGLLIGLPLGIAAGRFASDVFQERFGVIPDVIIPVGALAVLVPAALLAANVIAFVPGRIAARLRPAPVLRSE